MRLKDLMNRREAPPEDGMNGLACLLARCKPPCGRGWWERHRRRGFLSDGFDHIRLAGALVVIAVVLLITPLIS
jgi:hypothetical protein